MHRKIMEGDLVLKTAPQIMKGLSTTKFFPKWEGPYIAKEVSKNGYCKIATIGSKEVLGPINVKWIKMYYP